MRSQTTKVYTGRRKRALLTVALVVVAMAAAAALWYALFYEPAYEPPAFETNAVMGVPVPDASMAYGEVSTENGFSFSLAGTMYQQEDGSLLIYFTNPETSICNLMCEIADADDRVIYRSGVLRPGEYVERLSPLAEIANKAIDIDMTVYAFEPDTWYSLGTVSLGNILQPW